MPSSSRRRNSRRLRKNPKIVGFSVVPNRGSSGLRRTFLTCLRHAQEEFPDLGDIGFRTHRDAGDEGRHYAYCEQHPDDSLSITFAPDAADLTEKHITGLMMHELGHAIDFRYSAAELARRIGAGLPRERERRADEIANRTFGVKIRYDASIGYVQCVRCDGVSPRPRGLK